METSQVVKMSKSTATKRFPKKVELASNADAAQFNKWCGMFDTSRLEEVIISIPTWDRRGFSIGEVPPSVKKLTIRDDNLSILTISPTVEVLVIEQSQQRHIDLPDGIRRLVLGSGFIGSIKTFPSTLEELTILNWNQPWGFDASFPHRLQNIPDTVHTLEIGEAAPVVVWRWPTGVQKIILPQSHWGVSDWLNRDHAPMPDAEVEYREMAPLPPLGPLVRQYNEEYLEWETDEWEDDF